jgi:hypothetical protein
MVALTVITGGVIYEIRDFYQDKPYTNSPDDCLSDILFNIMGIFIAIFILKNKNYVPPELLVFSAVLAIALMLIGSKHIIVNMKDFNYHYTIPFYYNLKNDI